MVVLDSDKSKAFRHFGGSEYKYGFNFVMVRFTG